MSLDNSAADREARNAYLSRLDEAWEMCREAVESARDEYEGALDLARVSYEKEQNKSAAEHGAAIDEAWLDYKAAIADAPSITRRTSIAEARTAYNEVASSLRDTFEASQASGYQRYLRGAQKARGTFDGAVERALDAFRAASLEMADFGAAEHDAATSALLETGDPTAEEHDAATSAALLDAEDLTAAGNAAAGNAAAEDSENMEDSKSADDGGSPKSDEAGSSPDEAGSSPDEAGSSSDEVELNGNGALDDSYLELAEAIAARTGEPVEGTRRARSSKGAVSGASATAKRAG